jgi:VCBS repeat-containing protein|tara:strand:+ start:17446 stop:19104 length:1659 start_codon:yes stop_codon:yes gene_type:complete
MAIEILENTLLKLLVRRGTNYDREQITLETGELGYTTDTKRLYVGDGVTIGGIIVGNKWAGSAANLTTLAPVATGDYGYDTDNREFKICTKGSGSTLADWVTVATYLSASNPTITIDGNNRIAVGTLSAGNFSLNALGNSLTLDASSAIALSSAISIDAIYQRTTNVSSYLSLPSKLKINKVDYTFPATSPQRNTFLGYSTTDPGGNAKLAWQVPQIVYSAVAPTTAALIPVGTITPYGGPLSGAPYGWLNCNGQAVDAVTYSELLTAIGGQYGRDFSANTFNVPNLSSTFLFGFQSGASPAASTTRGMGLSAQKTSLSGTGMAFIIKAFGGVTNPTLTVSKNLSATITSGSGVVDNVTDSAFNPLSGEVQITRPQPGIELFTQEGTTHTFKMPNGISYVKFYVTGSGCPGDEVSGNAGSTAIGYLSARPGTEFPVVVGGAPSDNESGNSSYIYEPETAGTDPLVTAAGGQFGSQNAATPTVATSSPYLPTATQLILGGVGGIDTDGGGDEEDNGGAGYYGHAPAHGGGGGSHSNGPRGPAITTGLVMFEWN